MESDPESSSHTAAADLTKDPVTVTILAAIKPSKSSLITKIDTLLFECGLLRQNLDTFWGCLSIAESRISSVEDTTASNSQTLT